mgnify:CR=1 FL=1
MALAKAMTQEVYYQTSKREVSFCLNTIQDISGSDSINTVALILPVGDFDASHSTALSQLNALGVNVEALSIAPAADYRDDQGVGVWLANVPATLPFARIAVLQVAAMDKTYDQLPSLLLGIERAAADSDKQTNICIAFPDTCDAARMIRNLFYTGAHWCGIDSIFLSVNVLYFWGSGFVKSYFAECMEHYSNLNGIYTDEDFQTYAKQADTIVERVKTGNQTFGLTDRQIWGIALYTTDFFSKINRTLRANDSSSADYMTLLPILEAIDSGLTNLNAFSSNVYRAEGVLSDTRREDNQPGNEIVNLAYTSSTWDQTLMQLHTSKDYPTTFSFQMENEIQPHMVHDFHLVEAFSNFPAEHEVLAIRQMKYKVLFAYKETDSEIERDIVIGAEVPEWRK